MSTYVAFAPFAGNIEHSIVDRQLLIHLHQSGSQVHVVTCSGMMRALCPVLKGAGVTSKKATDRACANCRLNAHELWRDAGLSRHDLSDFARSSDEQVARELVIKQQLDPASRVHYENVDFSAMSRYSLLLWNKSSSLEPDSADWPTYLEQLGLCVRIYLASKRLTAHLQVCSKDDLRAVARDGFHPNASAFLHGAAAEGAHRMWFGSGLHSRRHNTSVFLGFEPAFVELRKSREAAACAQLPLTWSRAEGVLEHLEDLQFGRTTLAHSRAIAGESPKEVRESLGIPPNASVVTVLTSSEDEVQSAREIGAFVDYKGPYLNQLEWLERVLMMAPEVDAEVVVRVHPRLAPSPRFPTTAAQLQQIEHLVHDLGFANVTLDHPSEGRSLSSLISISDLCVNHQSTAGLEFLAQGVPLSHMQPSACPSYPAELLSLSKDWVSALHSLSHEGISLAVLSRLVWGLRWWSGLLLDGSVDVMASASAPSAPWGERNHGTDRLSRQGLARVGKRVASLGGPYGLDRPIRQRRARHKVASAERRASFLRAERVLEQIEARWEGAFDSQWRELHLIGLDVASTELPVVANFLNEVLLWYPPLREGAGIMGRWSAWGADILSVEET